MDFSEQRFRQLGGRNYSGARANYKRGLVAMQIDGADALEKALRDLGQDKEIIKALSTALVEAGEIMARAARLGAPRRSGRLYESIDVSTQLSRRQRKARPKTLGEAVAYVGARPIGPSVLLEFGTTKRHWKTGKSTGHVPAQPFMAPAFESTKFQVLQMFGKLLWIQIEKAANRIARRQAKGKT
jgi:HK97 gp10 family phage protein